MEELVTDFPQGVDRIGPESCPHCERKGTLHLETVTDEVTIRTTLGSFQTAITYSQVVCDSCEEAFTDAAGAAVYDSEIESKRKAFVAAQVRQIRELTGLSRSEFLAITKLGDASLTRWETGAGEPTAAYASFLVLLRLPENLRHLVAADRSARAAKQPDETTASSVALDEPKVSFRILKRTPDIINRSKHFQLRPQTRKAA